MTTLKKILKKHCDIPMCYKYQNEINAFGEWLRQHKIELLKQYKKDNSNSLASRISHCNELLEELK